MPTLRRTVFGRNTNERKRGSNAPLFTLMAFDVGRLTEKETIQIAIECLDALTLDMRIKAVLEVFAEGVEREELAAWLEPTD